MATKSAKSTSSGSGKGRTRNYATIVYPDSAPENWKTIISESKIPLFISPLHDKDINPTGEPKKPHYHVLILYDAVKTKEQAQAFISTFGGVGCEVVNSARGYARYLCHLDNPEKEQYSIEDVIAYGGANYSQVIGCAADKAKMIREMITWIEETDCTCWADLMRFAGEWRADWFDCLINSGAYVTKEYIKSRTWKLHNREEK